jgi:hypothetical protein
MRGQNQHLDSPINLISLQGSKGKTVLAAERHEVHRHSNHKELLIRALKQSLSADLILLR